MRVALCYKLLANVNCILFAKAFAVVVEVVVYAFTVDPEIELNSVPCVDLIDDFLSLEDLVVLRVTDLVFKPLLYGLWKIIL